MVLSIRNVLAGLVIGLLTIRRVRADDCDEISGPFQDVSHFGNRGYTPSTIFCHTKWLDGLVVTGMEVWGTSYHVSGLQFTYSDGSVGPMLGANNFGVGKDEDNGQGGTGKHDFISWTDKDLITNFKAATSSDGNALGLIHIEVAGKTLTVGEDDVGDGDVVNLGSGVLLGASGATNAFLSFFTPLFLANPTGSAEITSMTFDQNLDDLNKQQQNGIGQVVLADVYLQNTNTPPKNSSDHSFDQAYTFVGGQSVQKTTSVETSATNTFGLSISLEVGGEVGLPLVAEGSTSLTTTASYEYSTTTSKQTQSSETVQLSWNIGSSGTTDLIAPGHAKHCTAQVMSGHYKGGYTATVSLTIKTKPFTFKQRGTFESISNTDVFQSCKDILIADIPKDGKKLDASSTTKAGKRAVILKA